MHVCLKVTVKNVCLSFIRSKDVAKGEAGCKEYLRMLRKMYTLCKINKESKEVKQVAYLHDLDKACSF